jgi:hypothetical protein
VPDFTQELRLHPNFFGLTYEYYKYVSDEIYILVKHGGFSYNDCQHMPIHQRKIFLETLFEEAEAIQEKQNQAIGRSSS